MQFCLAGFLPDDQRLAVRRSGSTNPLDSQAEANGGSSKAYSGATSAVTASESGDAVVVGATVGSTGISFSPGVGFTLRDSGIGIFSGDEDQIVTARDRGSEYFLGTEFGALGPGGRGL